MSKKEPYQFQLVLTALRDFKIFYQTFIASTFGLSPFQALPWAVEIKDWAQIALFGSLGTLKGPNIRSKCVVTICLTSAGPSGAVGTISGSPGPSEDLGRTLWGQNEPF